MGLLISYWVLPKSGIPISCSTVQKMTLLDQQTNDIKKQINTFDDGLEDKFQMIS